MVVYNFTSFHIQTINLEEFKLLIRLFINKLKLKLKISPHLKRPFHNGFAISADFEAITIFRFQTITTEECVDKTETWVAYMN